MKVYALRVDPNDYDVFPYVDSIYSTKEKAEQAIRVMAIEAGEPALLLEKDFDIYEHAECWHYPDYDFQRYYIDEYELE